MLNRSQISAITLCVIALATILFGIYNCVIYQNVSNHLATDSLANDSDTLTIDTSIVTSATTAIATSTATEMVTTDPPEGCQRMLSFGYKAGDNLNESNLKVGTINSCLMWNKTRESLPISMDFHTTAVKLGHSVTIYGINDEYFAPYWSSFYRNVTSKEEQDAIACLVNDHATVEAFVFTWLKNPTPGNEETQIFQIIVAIVGQVSTYTIRIYSDNLPATTYSDPVTIVYVGDRIQFYLKGVSVEAVRGQRQIFDLTPAVGKSDNLTVVEEGKNCPIFC